MLIALSPRRSQDMTDSPHQGLQVAQPKSGRGCEGESLLQKGREREWRSKTVGGAILLAVACLCTVVAKNRILTGRTELTGPMGNGAGPSSHYEGSDGLSYPGWAGNRLMRGEVNLHVGAPGWEPGPDYYSTARYDNQPVIPSNLKSTFDPYTGIAACPTCKQLTTRTFEMSVTPRCDYSPNNEHIRNILKLETWWHGAEFSSALYKEYHWIGTEVEHFVTSNAKAVVLVPPCFFPKLARSELLALNTAVYQIGVSLLVVGGLQV